MKKKVIYTILIAILIIVGIIALVKHNTQVAEPGESGTATNSQATTSLADLLGPGFDSVAKPVLVSTTGPKYEVESEFRCPNNKAIQTKSFSGIKDARIELNLIDESSFKKDGVVESRQLVVRPVLNGSSTFYTTPDKHTVFGVEKLNAYIEEFGSRTFYDCDLATQSR